jgi:hypothetical protein
MTREEREEKLRDCSSALLADSDLDALPSAVESLEKNGMEGVMAILRRAGAPGTLRAATGASIHAHAG